MNGPDDQTIVYFDDECNLCHFSKEFYQKRDKAGKTLFLPLDQIKSEEMAGPVPEQFLHSPGVILFQNGKFYHKSDAILRSVRVLPRWKWVYGLIILPKWLRDFAYDVVAKHRYSLFGRKRKPGRDL